MSALQEVAELDELQAEIGTARGAVLTEVERQALTSLADLAAGRRGFRHARVRGWLAGPDVKEVVGRINAGWRFPHLRKLGYVTSQPAPDPARPRNPIVLWRITQEGEDEVARLEGRRPRRISPPRPDPGDQAQIYITQRAWSLLSALQRKDGFVPWKDVQYSAAGTRGGRLWAEDLTLLLNRGFAARENRGTRTKPQLWVTATATGRHVRATDVKSSKALVKVGVGSPERAG